MKITRRIVILSILSFLVLASYGGQSHFVSAQYDNNSGDFNLNLSPENPGPGQSATASVTSFLVNLDSLKISWYVDGKLVLSGIGEKKLKFTTAPVGVTKTVEVTVELASGPETKTFVLRAGDVDVLWQVTDSFAPPFYRGKTLLTSEAKIKAVAMPNVRTTSGTAVKPGNMIYRWTKNSNFDQPNSGYGKNSYTFSSAYLNDVETITVEATDAAGNGGTAKQTAVMVPSNPKILFYEESPLLGIRYNHALESPFVLASNEMTIVAEPYYLVPKNPISPRLVYSWTINEKPIGSPKEKNVLVVRKGANQTGTAKVQLSIDNFLSLMQNVKATLLINL